MDGHSPCQAHWKLSAAEYEWKIRSATAEGYARKQVSFSLGAACEDADVEKPIADFQDRPAATIAYAAIFVEVRQDYDHSSYAQT